LQAANPGQHDYAEAFYTLGTVLKQQGKLQESADALREAIRLQPDFAGAHTTYFSYRTTPAGRHCRSSSRDKSRSRNRATKKTAYRRLRLPQISAGVCWMPVTLTEQFRNFVPPISAVPDYALAHYQLGFALQRKGERQESENEFKKAAELDSNLEPPAH
jgi:tetratricopeptide (TPR) repeat protein